VQAAWAALRSRRHAKDPMVCWARAIARRRGKKIAVVALARKLAGILFAMWRDGTQYDALRAAASWGAVIGQAWSCATEDASLVTTPTPGAL
jgi:hypothetical protein